MSRVTNVILRTPLIGEKEYFSKEINKFFEPIKGFVNCNDSSLPRGWYGGSKMLEAELWIGALNYLDLEGFIKHLKSINWKVDYEDWVQIIYQEQNDYKFSIIEFEVIPK